MKRLLNLNPTIFASIACLYTMNYILVYVFGLTVFLRQTVQSRIGVGCESISRLPTVSILIEAPQSGQIFWALGNDILTPFLFLNQCLTFTYLRRMVSSQRRSVGQQCMQCLLVVSVIFSIVEVTMLYMVASFPFFGIQILYPFSKMVHMVGFMVGIPCSYFSTLLTAVVHAFLLLHTKDMLKHSVPVFKMRILIVVLWTCINVYLLFVAIDVFDECSFIDRNTFQIFEYVINLLILSRHVLDAYYVAFKLSINVLHKMNVRPNPLIIHFIKLF